MHDLHAESDEQLMVRCQSGRDEAAFSVLVGRYLSAGQAVAGQILSDRWLAEDAVQEAFVRVVRNRAGYRPDKPFSVWFYTILRNVCLDMIRRRRREVRALAAAARHLERTVEPAAGCADDPAELMACLPTEVRAALTLRIAHGLPFADVAAAMGISMEAAKKRVQRGLRTLQQRLAERADRIASPAMDVSHRPGRAGLPQPAR